MRFNTAHCWQCSKPLTFFVSAALNSRCSVLNVSSFISNKSGGYALKKETVAWTSKLQTFINFNLFIQKKSDTARWFRGVHSSPGRFFIAGAGRNPGSPPEHHRWEELCCELPWPAKPWFVRQAGGCPNGQKRLSETSMNTLKNAGFCSKSLDLGNLGWVTCKRGRIRFKNQEDEPMSSTVALHFEICSKCTQWLQSSFVKHDWKIPYTWRF